MNNQVQKAEGTAITTGQNVHPMEQLRNSITGQKSKFEMVLPAHISFEKFQSVVMTAAMVDPNLVKAHRPSLMLSCVKSATDGLLPDGRDAALVIFKSKIKDPESGRDVFVDKVQYMPMFMGILKKVRQSKEISSISVEVVYQKDTFKVLKGDDDKIVHEVYEGDDRGELRAAYCIAKLKDGSVQKTVMWRSDIEKVRRTSKSGAATENDVKYGKAKEVGEAKGIWKDWPEEMWKKTVFRRAAKWLPQSVDKDGNEIRVFQNDDSIKMIEDTIEDGSYERISDESEEQNAIEDNTQSEQPDLKKAVENKKADDKDAKSTEATQQSDGKSPESSDKSAKKGKEAGKVADKEQKQASNEGEKAEAPADEEKKPSLYDIEMEIRKLLKNSVNVVVLQETLAVEYADDLDAIKAGKPTAYADLKNLIDARLKELGGAE